MYKVETEEAEDATLGRPKRKPRCDILDSLALFTSFACLIFCICVITPKLSFSWQLGFQRQIIIIGFLLSIMNLCMKRIMPTTLLLLEARWGRSTLQNYQAIMTNSFLSSHTSSIWRLLLLAFILLPLGLSVAYKQFLGGLSSAEISPHSDNQYGLNFPSLGDYTPMNNSVYLMMNAAAGFMAASSNDSVPFPAADVPVPFGYNLLLLSNESVAVLDIPMPAYLDSMQRNMRHHENWTVSASVNAYVSTFNRGFEELRADDSFWETTLSWDPLHSFTIYDGAHDFGATAGFSYDHGYYLLGPYSQHNGEAVSIHGDIEDEAITAFRRTALMFNIRRQKCRGKWNIDRNSITLVEGDCGTSATYVNSSVAEVIPFWLDAMPVLVHSLHGLGVSRNHSQWHVPSFAMSSVTAFWARAAFMRDAMVEQYPDMAYYPTDEKILSFNHTLRPDWRLYLVLVVQPLLTLAAFVLGILFYSTPIGKGFGLASVLSGIERSSLRLLEGAAFSGELDTRVALEISSENITSDRGRLPSRQIRYRVAKDLKLKTGTNIIERSETYA